MKKIKNILMIGLLSFAGVRCSDFLEVTSDQELTYDTFIRPQAIAALRRRLFTMQSGSILTVSSCGR